MTNTSLTAFTANDIAANIAADLTTPIGSSHLDTLRRLGARFSARFSARLGTEASLLLSSANSGRVVLGTGTVPFEALPNRQQLLGRLDEVPGRTVILRCRSAAVLDDLPRLERLDQDHALCIEWHFDPSVPAERSEALGAAADLAAAGLEVRLVLESSGVGVDSLRLPLEGLFAEADRVGVSDIRLAEPAGSPGAGSHRIDLLRLEHGFPAVRPGRG